MQHRSDCKIEKLSTISGDVFLERTASYCILHLYLGSYLTYWNYPYTLMSITLYRDPNHTKDVLSDFPKGVTKLFESFMYLAEMSHINSSEADDLVKFEHLCTLNGEEMEQVVAAYENARMDNVWKLIKEDDR